MNFEEVRICIIGAGKLGLSFASYFSKKNCNFQILVRSESSLERATAIIPKSNIIRTLSEMNKLADLTILAVRDSEIRGAAEFLANHFQSKLKSKYIAHCSGMLSSDELSACKEYGSKNITLHPYQTFYLPSAETFNKVHWGLEGEIDAFIENFINFMGGEAHKIEKSNKKLYHISAVAMSNYLNSAIALGKLSSRAAGISPEEFAPVIINTTINNILASDKLENNTLTGPIARGDLLTIKLHIEELRKHRELLLPYSYMGLATLELANTAGIIDDKFYQECHALLFSEINVKQ